MKHIPIGLERVLVAAATDHSFQEELLSHREAALQARGLDLSESERIMLRAIPRAQLCAAIAGMDISPAALQRRSFLRAVAASAAAVASAEVLAGCGEDAVKGTRPDGPPSQDSGPDRALEAGEDQSPAAPDGIQAADQGSWLDGKTSWGIRPGE